ITDPMAIVHSQIMVRFLYMFGMAPDTRGFSHVKILILAAYAAGVLGVVCNREMRRQRGVRSLLLVSGVTLLVMIALDREAQHQYLIHFVVWMISLTAVAGVLLWYRVSVPRWVLVVGLVVLGVVCNREMRRQRGVRSLLLVSGVTLLVMIALDREAQHQYLIHFVVWMISLTAVDQILM